MVITQLSVTVFIVIISNVFIKNKCTWNFWLGPCYFILSNGMKLLVGDTIKKPHHKPQIVEKALAQLGAREYNLWYLSFTRPGMLGK